MVTKALLQYLMLLAPDPDFPELWARILQVLQDCTKNRNEELSEAVPETLKNVLLVMAARRVLTRDWKDSEGRALWDMTWHKARSISSGLTPQLLVSSGLDRPERPESRGAVASGPGPGAPPSSPSPTPGHQAPYPAMQHSPAGIDGEERSGQQAASGVPAQIGSNESSGQHAYHPQPPLGAAQEGGNAFAAAQPGGSFSGGAGPQAGFSHTDGQPDALRSAADQTGSATEQSELSQPAASAQLPVYQEATTLHISSPSKAVGQSSSQDPNQTPSEAPQLGRLSPPSNMELHNTMSSEPSSHKLSALEGRYATGVPVTADEAFNRALQQRHSRQGSWGSDTSASSVPNPAAFSTAPAAVAASAEGVSDNVSTSRLLATIHSGIPSTDDDGPIFSELGKLVAEEEAEAAGQGRGHEEGQLATGGLEGQDRDVDLNQAPGLRHLQVVQNQDTQQLMGSPRIHQDELSGGLILAPGSETTASVSEPLADIAGGKSGTEAEIENPYDSMPAAGTSSASQDVGLGSAPDTSPPGQNATAHGQADVTPHPADSDRQGEVANSKKDAHSSDEYSEQQQSQQASSGCKQS